MDASARAFRAIALAVLHGKNFPTVGTRTLSTIVGLTVDFRVQRYLAFL
jgi:hypothetical protein